MNNTVQTCQDNMAKINIGATLFRGSRAWIVTHHRRRETGIDLTLRHGRREFVLQVPICISGPCLSDVGLRSGSLAPTQRTLLVEGASHG
ncbi:hypothetical protein [Pigmentiphaga litoralis]|uniref:hypothetical protein n=1 Tax=Pigmentiphaga litoralis TaxID=516702 RepID=UPI0016760B4D|nr:hypothetical protein [Pigmentiphaga litoralis]